MTMPSSLLFLPGALGRMDFWQPAAGLIAFPANQVHVGWPGFGPTPADPDINGIDALVSLVLRQMHAPCALIAQSMGGVIAIRAALARPDLVTHLILAATSGGLDTGALGAEDWRPFVRAHHPALPAWFMDDHADLTDDLARLTMPTLLLWGGADPLSPVAVGQQLASRLPNAKLHVFPGADHDLAFSHARDIATLIDMHLRQP